MERDAQLVDPLSEVTRKERRVLLGVSVVGLAVVKVGIIPTEIPAFGIKFDVSNQQALLHIYAFVVAYFLTAFSIYAMTDMLAFWDDVGEHFRKKAIAPETTRHEHVMPFLVKTLQIFVPVAMLLRAFFDFLFPILLGVFSIHLLGLS